MREAARARSSRSWVAAPGLTLLALAVGCTAAPLADKPCPCVADAGYVCCETLMTCMTDLAQCPPAPCASKPLSNPVITSGGTTVPADLDAGTDTAVKFGTAPEQWVSYVYAGAGETNPTLTGTPEGDGFRVHATFASYVDDGTQAFEGVGVTFLGDTCIDGSQLIGMRFDYEGDLTPLHVGLISIGDVSTKYRHGLCPLGTMCYGPAASFIPKLGDNPVLLSQLGGGNPQLKLDAGHIVNVQWQIPAPAKLSLDFTIRNVRFF